MLLGLGRGSGPRSIAGMRPVDGRYLRPLLGLRRADTEAACATRSSCRTGRTRTTPTRASSGPGCVPRCCRCWRTSCRAGWPARWPGPPTSCRTTWPRWISSPAQALAAAEPDGELRVEALADQPRAILARVVKRWAEAAGADPLSAVHVRQLTALIADWHGQLGVDLPGGRRAVRSAGRLRLDRTPAD